MIASAFESTVADEAERDDGICQGNGAGGDRFCGLHVFLQQERGSGEDIADVIKTIPGVVGREFLIRAEVDPHQIADGVAVFHAV